MDDNMQSRDKPLGTHTEKHNTVPPHPVVPEAPPRLGRRVSFGGNIRKPSTELSPTAEKILARKPTPCNADFAEEVRRSGIAELVKDNPEFAFLDTLGEPLQQPASEQPQSSTIPKVTSIPLQSAEDMLPDQTMQAPRPDAVKDVRGSTLAETTKP